MSTVPQTSEAMQWVVQEYPRQIERETGFVQRSSAQLDGPTFVQSLVFGWMDRPDASYTQLRHVAATLGVSVSKQAVEQRFSQASVDLLKAVLQEAGKQVICSDGQVPELLSRFAGVYVQDGSIVSLPQELAERYPGCGGSCLQAGRSSLRLQVRWEMGRGGLQGPWLQAGRVAERSGEAIETPMPVGSLFIGDSGYFALADMRQRSRQGDFWMTPAKGQIGLYDEHGVKCTLESFLKQHEQESQVDVWIQLGVQERLPVRLVAVRVRAEVAAKRRERARVRTCKPAHRKGAQPCGPGRNCKGGRPKKDHRKQKRLSASALRLADWTIILTNVPVKQLSVNEVLVLMRIRWQEELLWKLWKQMGKIDTWRSEKAVRIETEIYAKLVGLLIEHWMLLLGCWQDPRRSMFKAQQMSQWAAPALCFALAGEMKLSRVIARITAAMSQGCRVEPRHTRPNTAQLLEDPKLIRGFG
jgi:hypothetical protein